MSDSQISQLLTIKMPVANLQDFVAKYGRLFSNSGFYLPTNQLRPIGSLLPFKLLKADGTILLSGVGKVVWAKSQAEAAGGFFGLGLNYYQFDPPMLSQLEEILQLAGVAGAPQMVAPVVAPNLTMSNLAKNLSKPVSKKKGPVLGIDLGTTNSACAVVVDNLPYLISRNGQTTIPSIVAIDDSGKLLVGHDAKMQMVKNPATAVYAAKRLIGRNFHSHTVQTIRERMHYEIFCMPDGECGVRIAGREFSLVRISSLVLRELRGMAEEHLGTNVDRCVISVPAYYNEAQRRAVRHAGEMAGMEVMRIVSEPTAAAMAYGHKSMSDQRVLVYDLGGGTFDASLLDLSSSVYEVAATGGDNFLGGGDFDNRILEYCMDHLANKYKIDLNGQTTAIQRLKLACEASKCILSENEKTEITLPYLTTHKGERFDFSMPFERQKLHELTGDLVDLTLGVCDKVIQAAGRSPQELDSIILVGGQSRYPLIHERIRQRYGKRPDTSVNPDEAVALGAALLGDSIDRFDTVVLIDVLPMALGTALRGGDFKEIIPAHSKLPVTGEYTLTAEAATVEIPVFQGDSALALDNEYLGTATIDNVPVGAQVKFNFNFSENGQLAVSYSVNGQAEQNVKLYASDTPDGIAKKLDIPQDLIPPRQVAVAEDKSSFFMRLFKK